MSVSRSSRLLAATSIVVAACSSGMGSDDLPDDRIWISATRLVLSPGDTTRIGVVTSRNGILFFSGGIRRDEQELGSSGTWTSSNAEIAAFEPGGIVRAVSIGDVVLTVRVGEFEDSARVFVRDAAASGAEFEEIDVGSDHACGRTSTNALYCWGTSWYGEIGLGTVRRFTATVSPALVSGLPPVTQFSLGLTSSCALDMSGRAYCWGEDLMAGVLGVTRPIASPVPTEHRFVSIAVGALIACGATADGRVYCWGFDIQGVRQITAPAPIASVSAGYSHVCGLSAAGVVYCSAPGNTLAPLNTTMSFLSISAGACGVSSDRRVACWGAGFGDGLTPVVIPGLDNVARVGAGGSHACAVREDGNAFCWGEDIRGQLGNGPLTFPIPDRLTPVPVSLSDAVTMISVGLESTCALTALRQAYCWGLNTSGQLGIGRHDFAAGISLRFVESPVAVRFVP